MDIPATKHVLIIGGGLAGPCLALSLARHNISSTIFEIRKERADSGGSISLGPNGLRVLDRYAGVYHKLSKIGFSYSKFGAYTAEGEQLGNINVGELDEQGNGYPALRIMRPELHKALIEAAEEKKDLIQVKYGKKFTKIEEKSDSVTVHFEDGSEATGDILIGADGVHSKVRDYVLGDKTVKSSFSNLFILSGFVSSSIIDRPPGFQLPAFLFTPAGFIMAIPINADGSTLAYGINKNTTIERTREEWADFEKSGQAALEAKKDYDSVKTQPLRSILDKSENSEAKVWAPYSIPDIETWHTKRVCLLGDAAHGMPPNGLGSGLAFEDTALLTRMLVAQQEKEEYSSLFERFEQLRRTRINPIRKEGVASGFRKETGPWMWYLKKLAFRAFFWWKGGELQHVTAYDVDTVDISPK